MSSLFSFITINKIQSSFLILILGVFRISSKMQLCAEVPDASSIFRRFILSSKLHVSLSRFPEFYTFQNIISPINPMFILKLTGINLLPAVLKVTYFPSSHQLSFCYNPNLTIDLSVLNFLNQTIQFSNNIRQFSHKLAVTPVPPANFLKYLYTI